MQPRSELLDSGGEGRKKYYNSDIIQRYNIMLLLDVFCMVIVFRTSHFRLRCRKQIRIMQNCSRPEATKIS